MKKKILPVLIGLAVVLAGFLTFVALQPSEFLVTRSAVTTSGRSDFLGKAVCLFMDMDKRVGG